MLLLLQRDRRQTTQGLRLLTNMAKSILEPGFNMKKILIAVFAWVMVSAVPAGATSVVQFSFDSLCETAEKIAHVTCVSSEVVEEEDGIRTRTRFKVVESVKGTFGDEIEIALPGGALGDRRVTIAGIPSFKAGEETVLFLSGPDRIGSPWPVGLGQGCWFRGQVS